jgi:hypothetical protein
MGEDTRLERGKSRGGGEKGGRGVPENGYRGDEVDTTEEETDGEAETDKEEEERQKDAGERQRQRARARDGERQDVRRGRRASREGESQRRLDMS